jgi:hypothetical protein
VDGVPPLRDVAGRVVLPRGSHVFTRTIDGQQQRHELVTRGSELERLDLPPLPAPAPTPATPIIEPPVPEPAARPTKQFEPDARFFEWPPPARALALVLGGTALVGTSVGLSVLAHRRYNRIAALCRKQDGGGCTDQEKRKHGDDEHVIPLTRSARTLSVLGPLTLAAGLLDWWGAFTARRPAASVAVAVGRDSTALELSFSL